jgi:hypothetical protein
MQGARSFAFGPRGAQGCRFRRLDDLTRLGRSTGATNRMGCTPQDLRAVMDGFVGGSVQRYRHALNRRFIYTAGVEAVAETAGAYWLLDIVALKMAGLYASAWRAGTASIGLVTVEVHERGAEARPPAAATISLSLEDDAPPAFTEDIDFTDFPEGKWTFYLGTDEEGDDAFVTTMMVPQEY